MARKNQNKSSVIGAHVSSNILNTNLGAFPQEQRLMPRKLLATAENGKVYRLEMTPAMGCAVYKVDGVVIKNGLKCDKLILVDTDPNNNRWTEVFVELKGKNVDHAIAQLRETIKNPLFYHPTITKRKARIVSQSVPCNTGRSIVEVARNEFKSKYNVSLKVSSQQMTESIKA